MAAFRTILAAFAAIPLPLAAVEAASPFEDCKITVMSERAIDDALIGNVIAGINVLPEEVDFSRDGQTLSIDGFVLSNMRLDYEKGIWREALFYNGTTKFQFIGKTVFPGIWEIRADEICFNYNSESAEMRCKHVVEITACGLLDGKYFAATENGKMSLTSKIVGVYLK